MPGLPRRRVQVSLEFEMVVHDETFALTDELLEREVGEMVGAALPTRLGIGESKSLVPDGRGGWYAKPCVLCVLRHVGVIPAPREAPPAGEPSASVAPEAEPARPPLRIVAP